MNECNRMWSSFWRRNVEFLEDSEGPEFSGAADVVQEKSELLHIREATVRTRLVRARKLLKQQLKEAWKDEE